MMSYTMTIQRTATVLTLLVVAASTEKYTFSSAMSVSLETGNTNQEISNALNQLVLENAETLSLFESNIEQISKFQELYEQAYNGPETARGRNLAMLKEIEEDSLAAMKNLPILLQLYDKITHVIVDTNQRIVQSINMAEGNSQSFGSPSRSSGGTNSSPQRSLHARYEDGTPSTSFAVNSPSFVAGAPYGNSVNSQRSFNAASPDTCDPVLAAQKAAEKVMGSGYSPGRGPKRDSATERKSFMDHDFHKKQSSEDAAIRAEAAKIKYAHLALAKVPREEIVKIVKSIATPGVGKVMREAATEGNVKKLSELLEKWKGDRIIDSVNEKGESAVWLAAAKGQAQCVDLLARFGADLNKQSNFLETPAYVASQNGRHKELEELIRYGADLRIRDKRGEEPIHTATYYRRFKCLELLLLNGIAANNPDKDGRTPIYVAAYHNNVAEMHLLVEWGADINIARNNGRTPCYVASAEGNPEVLKCLIDLGCDMNAKEKYGRTPLAAADNEDIKKILRAADASYL